MQQQTTDTRKSTTRQS